MSRKTKFNAYSNGMSGPGHSSELTLTEDAVALKLRPDLTDIIKGNLEFFL